MRLHDSDRPLIEFSGCDVVHQSEVLERVSIAGGQYHSATLGGPCLATWQRPGWAAKHGCIFSFHQKIKKSSPLPKLLECG